jgi:hypothetical protein
MAGKARWQGGVMSKEVEAPIVYRFVAPDGRSYVGSVRHGQNRAVALARSNRRIDTALKEYPAATWFFEVLENFARGCSDLDLRAAEQRHIARLRTWMPEYGFNMHPAVAKMASSEQCAQVCADRKRARAEWLRWLNEGGEELRLRFGAEQWAAIQAEARALHEQEHAERRRKRDEVRARRAKLTGSRAGKKKLDYLRALLPRPATPEAMH